MTARIIDGKAAAAAIRKRLKDEVDEFISDFGHAPGLATVLVGGDPASQVYVASKRKLAVQAGFTDHHVHVSGDALESEVAETITKLAGDPAVSGILLQLPLPNGLNAGALIDLIPPEKDVDGLTTMSAGLLSRGKDGLRPCTPSGVVELLDISEIPLDGARVVIVGRSELVGAPLAQLLTQRNATVTLCHSRTKDLEAATKGADIVIAAAGVRGLINGRHLQPGTAVIDVGIHRTDEGLKGDVDYDSASLVAGWITPVPGGVGPMTIAMLLNNTLTAARRQNSA
ncbi:bifunctional 5,10-methylenetetrahydrofolate dehydrogenase/5,10-methenyltetrahydrofolate cyclohydrolase [Glutamicibacter creatinolyticus]|uniref:bifunctional 5,10-methylenetetrahydrofolate dehydrogenase/5,10-methenyltetrahydrofolate cyclohydrolase n=1 Tax=Glutamicibacter creatinolyticus TaxID=162496 RepID=UPI0037BEC821